MIHIPTFLEFQFVSRRRSLTVDGGVGVERTGSRTAKRADVAWIYLIVGFG